VTATAIATADFAPPRWLRNPHVQSLYSSLPSHRLRVARRARELVSGSRRWLVDCGDGVRLLALHARQHDADRAPRRLVVLLHGWEGSADSLYTLSLGQSLFERGYDVVRLNLRDHGGSEALNPDLFHSCRIAEVVGALKRIHDEHPGHELDVVGFSLGGNFALRVAVRARDAGIALRHVVAVCPVLDPANTLAALERGPGIYRAYFLQAWRGSLRRKSAAWPGRYELRDMLRLTSLTEMTAQLVTRYTEYPALEDYLRGYALVGDTLARLDVPSRLIAALDDPIIPAADLDRLARSPSLTVTRTAFGGHCGFHDGDTRSSWLERTICAELLDDRALAADAQQPEPCGHRLHCHNAGALARGRES
jgi:predicted alpha/beta-fold hydrolase